MNNHLIDEQIRSAFRELGERRQPPPVTATAILDAMSRRRRRHRMTVVAAVVAVGGAVVVPPTVVALRDDSPTVQVASNGGSQPLPDKALRLLAVSGVDVEPQPTSTKAAVSLQQALDATRLMWRNVPAAKTTATLAIVTTHQSGKELSNGEFVPSLDHELVWVIAFTDIPRALVPDLAPAPAGNSARRLATIVAFVSSDRPVPLSYVAF